MKSLCLFVDSERTDQYLNSLVYCVLRLDVRRVTFIHIKGLIPEQPRAADTGLSARAMGGVQAQLQGLAVRGEYLFSTGPHAGTHRSLADVYSAERAREIQSLYRRCQEADLIYSNEAIEYSDLRKCMRRLAALGADAYVDITAIRKRYVGDLVATSLVEGIQGLYTFDLTGARPDFEQPWRLLIHDLEDQKPPAFAYINILNTALYRSCVRLVALRAPALRVTLGVTVTLLLAVALGSWYLGSESPAIRTMFAISGVASILSLFFVFVPPRSGR